MVIYIDENICQLCPVSLTICCYCKISDKVLDFLIVNLFVNIEIISVFTRDSL
jgi:hypothetical protein